jgi:hypothetical protein
VRVGADELGNTRGFEDIAVENRSHAGKRCGLGRMSWVIQEGSKTSRLKTAPTQARGAGWGE